ncbi:hypothetical protein [Stutzerimonas frequens]|uniref:hypothetical protein n=1 Tax=Stutzerimonas frequens TaxID=2968969 RepID=UPI00190AA4F0|nr:hypothetical protein [Stutzerimonas frequens]MBK3757968.1 hypothetical protein [Stutzerimonas frequens]MBK3872293.1 hypothetical protein [Stutzerimonas frequens]MBK3910824.1 hypothetical protein [Stutzerimonas frequens]MBK3930104.1 hypothetical protein [Stutzerimonas frequens]
MTIQYRDPTEEATLDAILRAALVELDERAPHMEPADVARSRHEIEQALAREPEAWKRALMMAKQLHIDELGGTVQ